MEKSVEVLSIMVGFSKHRMSYFTDIYDRGPITISPGGDIKVKDRTRDKYKNYGKGESDPAVFSNLIINVKYEGEEHTFKIEHLSQKLRNELEKNTRSVIFKIPSSEKNKDDYYFNQKGPWKKLNVRFDPAVKKKLHKRRNHFR